MAVNTDNSNPLYPAFDTSVKFYASLSRKQAKGEDPIRMEEDGTLVYVEPGAICFVSDATGNSIFLDSKIFGDGAKAGSVSGGGSGGGGITEVTLDMVPVISKDGEVLKNLSDYFNADGTFITEGISIIKNNADGTTSEVISITKDGIAFGDDIYITKGNFDTYIASVKEELNSEITAAETRAKLYADSILSSVYVVKGSVQLYADLLKVSDPQIGWVYNVILAHNNVPPGTNYVYTESGWDALGGSVDLSNYKSSADTETAIANALQSAKDYADSGISPLRETIQTNATAITNTNTRIDTINTDITAINTTLTTHNTNILTNSTNITNIGLLLTWQ